MTEAFRLALLVEQYGHTTPEQSTVDRRAEHPQDNELTQAARRRILRQLDERKAS
jgi:hypothetical protein